MKKVIRLFLVGCLLLSLCACNNKSDGNNSSTNVSSQNDVQADETKPETTTQTTKKYILQNSNYVLKREISGDLEIKYEYDSLGRLRTHIINVLGSASIGTYRDYDSNGNPKSLYWGGDDRNTFIYDSNGNMLEVCEFSDGKLSNKKSYEYDEYGNVIKVHAEYYGNSCYTSTRYEYESNEKYFTYEYNSATGKTTKTSYFCEYDSNGNLIKKTKTWTAYAFGEAESHTAHTTYEYSLRTDIVNGSPASTNSNSDTSTSDKKTEEKAEEASINKTGNNNGGNNSSSVKQTTQDTEKVIPKAPELTDKDHYNEARRLFDSFIKELKLKKHGTPNQNVGGLAFELKEELKLCNGYSNSAQMLKIAEKLHSLWLNDPPNSMSEGFAFDELTVSVNQSNITIQKEDISEYGDDLTLNFNIDNSSFTAEITNFFEQKSASSPGYWRTAGIVQYLTSRFTNISDTTALFDIVKDESNWSFSETRTSGTFAQAYSGHQIEIKLEVNGSGRLNCNISVK